MHFTLDPGPAQAYPLVAEPIAAACLEDPVPKPTPAGKLIKNAREISGLNQTDFAKEIGKTQSVVSRYECGSVIPPGDVIIHCMNILQIAPLPRPSPVDLMALLEERLRSPKFARLRTILADLIETVSTPIQN